jgi:hypothetical protein
MTLITRYKLKKLHYKLPPRADNKTTTRGPAETTKTRLTSVRANSRFIIKIKFFYKKSKSNNIIK